MVLLYKDYWGFKEKPFENTPDPRFLYLSSQHEEALMRMLYVVNERKGACMLTGEYGSGKTLLGRVVTSKLMNEDDKYKVALIINPAIPSLALLFEIVYQLGGNPSKRDKKIELLHNLNNMLYNSVDSNRHTVIIIDEAQAIEDEDAFEELRLLLNFQLDKRFLLTILLIGQPELRRKISHLKQFLQRISIKCHLDALDEPETKKYIEHRCKVAGREQIVFNDNACRLIYESSGGIPRLINNICDMCLVIGFGEHVGSIDGRIAEEVIKDVGNFNIAEEKILKGNA